MHTQQVSRPCTEELVLAVSLELAMAKWKVALPAMARSAQRHGAVC